MAFDFDKEIQINDTFTDKVSFDIICNDVTEFNNIIKSYLQNHPDILENMIINCYEVFSELDNHVFDIVSDNKIQLSFDPSKHQPYLFHAWNYQLCWLIDDAWVWELFYRICESDFFVQYHTYHDSLDKRENIPFFIHKNMNINDNNHQTFLGVWDDSGKFLCRYEDLLHAMKYCYCISKNTKKSFIMDVGGLMSELSNDKYYIEEMQAKLHKFLIHSQYPNYKESSEHIKLSKNIISLFLHLFYNSKCPWSMSNQIYLKMQKSYPVSFWYSIFIDPETKNIRTYPDFIDILKSRFNSLGRSFII